MTIGDARAHIADLIAAGFKIGGIGLICVFVALWIWMLVDNRPTGNGTRR